MSAVVVPAGAGEPLLEVRGLHAGYAASEVLHGVDLDVAAGEAVALLGRNGMGKTTLVRAITGLHPARSGQVRFRGSAIEAEPPHRIARRGIGLVPEGRQIFANLTVLEHLSAFERARDGERAGS
ncbi:MAG: ATP-binding cassette domain-containing protein, partial [Caldimonas sp.]